VHGPAKACLVSRCAKCSSRPWRNASAPWTPFQKAALEFLTDNGGAYIADETRRIARALGIKPVNTPVCSPQSNGMAESFVNTFKRDYVSRMDLADAATVMEQLPAAFEHFNTVHPHSSLKMRSPREFRQHQQRVAQFGKSLHCE
jgi:putative transposase